MSLLLGPQTVQTAARSPSRLYCTLGTMTGASGALTSGTAYFVCVGETQQYVLPRYVYAWMTSVGTGAQTAEVGLFYSPLAPAAVAQTLYPICTSGSVTDLTAGTSALKGNTAAFDVPPVRPGVWLWCGIRCALGTTQPNFGGANNDWGKVYVMSGASSALTGVSSVSPASIGTGIGVNMFLVTA